LLKRLGPVFQFKGVLAGSFVSDSFALLGLLSESLLLLVQGSLLLLIARLDHQHSGHCRADNRANNKGYNSVQHLSVP
jgi:hypothetical protein